MTQVNAKDSRTLISTNFFNVSAVLYMFLSVPGGFQLKFYPLPPLLNPTVTTIIWFFSERPNDDRPNWNTEKTNPCLVVDSRVTVFPYSQSACTVVTNGLDSFRICTAESFRSINECPKKYLISNCYSPLRIVSIMPTTFGKNMRLLDWTSGLRSFPDADDDILSSQLTKLLRFMSRIGKIPRSWYVPIM